MNFTQEYNKMNKTDKEKFSKCANKLLSCCFITKDKEDDKVDYYFYKRKDYLFIEYFKVLNYELFIEEAYGVIYLQNTESFNRVRFNMIESIILLIIRILFQDKLNEISMSTKITITTGNIHEKIEALGLQDKRIKKQDLETAIRKFRKFHLIEKIDTDLQKDSSKVLIYPTILYAVKVDNINTVYQIINSYKGGYND